jgi:hypothetical protein
MLPPYLPAITLPISFELAPVASIARTSNSNETEPSSVSAFAIRD